jgi:hypothetical protein
MDLMKKPTLPAISAKLLMNGSEHTQRIPFAFLFKMILRLEGLSELANGDSERILSSVTPQGIDLNSILKQNGCIGQKLAHHVIPGWKEWAVSLAVATRSDIVKLR